MNFPDAFFAERQKVLFFFEKKNQKTFAAYPCGRTAGAAQRIDKSLFASFSSEKEESLNRSQEFPMRVAALTILLAAVPALAQPPAAMQMPAAPQTSSAPAPAAPKIPGAAFVPMNQATQDYKQSMDKMMGDMNAPYTGDADYDFVTHMIPHHQGAIDMAETELKYGKDAKLKQLAGRIIAAQQREISFMQSWQEKHKSQVGKNIPPNIQWK